MADITLVDSGDHSGGYPAQSCPRGGAAIDVSAYSTLRLTLSVTGCNASAKPILSVWLETSSNGADWRALHDFEDMTAIGSQRVVLATHDTYVRAGHHARSMATGQAPGFVWALAGTALP